MVLAFVSSSVSVLVDWPAAVLLGVWTKGKLVSVAHWHSVH